jgi:type IV pilus assembly protein PilF
MRICQIIGFCLLTACAPLQGKPPNPAGFTLGENAADSTPAKSEEKSPSSKAEPVFKKHVQQALAYLNDDKPGLALTEIDQALILAPNDVHALNVAGLIYEKMGDTQSALIHLSNAVFQAPDDPYSRNNYGTLLCRLGQPREAIAQFEKVATMKGYATPEIAYTNAGLCARTIPDLDLAGRHFNTALQVNPKTPTALYQIAKLSYDEGSYAAAREDLQHYLQVGPHTPKTLLLRVQIEAALGNRATQEAYRNQLAKLFPASLEAAHAKSMPLTNAKLAAADTSPAKTTMPDATPATAASEQEVAEPRSEEWLLQQSPERYSIQLMSGADKQSVMDFVRRHGITGDLAYFEFQRGGTPRYALLYGNFESLGAAESALAELSPTVAANQPWLRRFGQVHKLIQENALVLQRATP